MKIVARFSGIVAYSDNSHQQFAGHIDERGNTSVNLQSESEEAVYRAGSYLGENGTLDDTLALLSGTILLTPSAPSETKTVTGLSGEISGMVAYDNNDKGGFIAQYTDKVGPHIPDGGDIANWEAALANSEALARIVELFESVVGAGNASVTP